MRTTYHHGDLAPAMIAAAKALLEEGGVGAVSVCETARRVGVSPTATYRHFVDKDALLAAVAAEGFREFGAALAEAAESGAPMAAMGQAYVRFALARRGLFRLMFGPEFADRERHPALQVAANAAFGWLEARVRNGGEAGPAGREAAIAAWALVHGLANLFLDGLLPEAEAEALTRAITTQPCG